MTDKNEFDPPANFAGSLLPALLAVGMFVVYALTLDHWVSPESLRRIAGLSGLTWTSDVSSPVYFLVTYPIRWLPAPQIPLAANLFSAICAALTLVWLARSVALLPHAWLIGRKRGEDDGPNQPIRNNAWLPPTLAVVACGLQLSFWEQATVAGGEMLDVLLFSYLIRCLLEYRSSKRESWLLRFAFVTGLAMADDWVMVAFFPAFLAALLLFLGLGRFSDPKFLKEVIEKKARWFNATLSLRLLVCWVAGGSLLLLMPLVASQSANGRVNFWLGLGYSIRTYYTLLTAFPLRIVGLLSLTSVVPVIFMGISQRRVRGDWNPKAKRITRMVSQIMHGFFLAACLLTALDCPLSPRHLQPTFACLPLYYLTALGIGYYSGYFLIAFEPGARRSRRHASQPSAYPNLISVGVVGLLLAMSLLLLAYKNLPLIQRQRTSALNSYLGVLLKSLPAKGAIIMSEDVTRLRWLEVGLIRAGRESDYTLVDTALLTHFPGYLPYLDRRHPDFKLMAGLTNHLSEITSPPVLVQWIQNLSRTRELYLMHPFVGYLAEVFYAQPRELLYQLRPYPANTIMPPPMSAAALAGNQAFWHQVGDEQFPALLRRLEPPKSEGGNPIDRLLELAHAQPELDYGAIQAGNYYSLMLDGWGVELQRGGKLVEAGGCFETARRLNPENNSAQINLACNRELQAHTQLVMESNAHLEDFLGKHRDWDQSLRQDGPTDDPNSCYRLGILFSDGHMFRQSLQQYLRAQALAPDATNAPERLADLYVEMSDYSNALAEADYVLHLDPDNSRVTLVKGLSLVQLGKPYDALPALNDAVNLQTNETGARLIRALAYLKLNKLPAAQEDYAQVARANPAVYPAYYGLAEIAFRSKDTNTAIQNCKLYLAKAPAGSPEVEQIKKWLRELKVPVSP